MNRNDDRTDSRTERTDAGDRPRSVSPTRKALSRLLSSPAALFSLTFLVAIFMLCFLGPEIIQYAAPEVDYRSGQLANQYQPPGWPHVFGTDLHGRDLFVRILYGGRVSLLVGFVATFVSLVIGVTWGAVAGYVGGWTDALMMRIVDMLYALPFLFLVILLMALVPRKELSTVEIMLILFFALGAVQWLTMSRIVRGEVLTLKENDYIEGALAQGVPGPKIVIRHLLPNLIGPVVVYASLTLPQVVLQEAFLSFLGLGIQPPFPSWGSLMNEGRSALTPVTQRWWLIVFPALFLSGTLLSLNLLGDCLRDAFDPTTRINVET